MSFISRIKQTLGITSIEVQQEAAAIASRQTADAITNLTTLVGQLVRKIDEQPKAEIESEAQIAKMRAVMAEQEKIVAELKNKLEAAKTDAVAAFLLKAKEAVSDQRQAGRPKVDGTNINLKVRSELFDQIRLIEQLLPKFNRTEFTNEGISLRIEQVINDNPQWRSTMAEIKKESLTDYRQHEINF